MASPKLMESSVQILGVVSDYSSLSRDIDELIEAFAVAGCLQLQQMKEVWRSRGFSFIFDVRPRPVMEPSFFMQVLFSSTLVHLSSTESFSWRLGALYTLYILYQIQEFTPKVKIYLSLEDLKSLLLLVKEIKQEQVSVAAKVVQFLFKQNAFLYGHTSVTHKAVEEAAERRMQQVQRRVKMARSSLFANVPANEHIYGSLATGLELDEESSDLIREYNQCREGIFQRVNSQEQQPNQITIYKEIAQASKDQEEFRTAYIADKQVQAELAQDTNLGFGGDFDLEGFEFNDDLESFN